MSRLGPRPVGAAAADREPPRVKPRDRLLVEWVADAAVGDRIPEPWRWARSPTESVILTLAGLGVIAAPPAGADLARVVEEAAVAARAWLAEYPPGP